MRRGRNTIWLGQMRHFSIGLTIFPPILDFAIKEDNDINRAELETHQTATFVRFWGISSNNSMSNVTGIHYCDTRHRTNKLVIIQTHKLAYFETLFQRNRRNLFKKCKARAWVRADSDSLNSPEERTNGQSWRIVFLPKLGFRILFETVFYSEFQTAIVLACRNRRETDQKTSCLDIYRVQ